MLKIDLMAQLPHAVDRERVGRAWRILLQPLVQTLFNTRTNRRKWPQGVVQVKGDGANNHSPFYSAHDGLPLQRLDIVRSRRKLPKSVVILLG